MTSYHQRRHTIAEPSSVGFGPPLLVTMVFMDDRSDALSMPTSVRGGVVWPRHEVRPSTFLSQASFLHCPRFDTLTTALVAHAPPHWIVDIRTVCVLFRGPHKAKKDERPVPHVIISRNQWETVRMETTSKRRNNAKLNEIRLVIIPAAADWGIPLIPRELWDASLRQMSITPADSRRSALYAQAMVNLVAHHRDHANKVLAPFIADEAPPQEDATPPPEDPTAPQVPTSGGWFPFRLLSHLRPAPDSSTTPQVTQTQPIPVPGHHHANQPHQLRHRRTLSNVLEGYEFPTTPNHAYSSHEHRTPHSHSHPHPLLGSPLPVLATTSLNHGDPRPSHTVHHLGRAHHRYQTMTGLDPRAKPPATRPTGSWGNWFNWSP
ncbi:uncharacterized protein LOC62_01G000945 [Vanrija pseudolonga]|uniref:Uncharacterized protein n=1 Tax=Vanrija pseudolonga TaxID=143232 RepID=A0AAF1BHB8_9TREE|nr:hypothetical protein LOC62_01G000945 [Vanrija pseudolonga]